LDYYHSASSMALTPPPSNPSYWLLPDSMDPSMRPFDDAAGLNAYQFCPDLCMDSPLLDPWELQDQDSLSLESTSPVLDHEPFIFDSGEPSQSPGSVCGSRSVSPTNPMQSTPLPAESRCTRRLRIRTNSARSEQSQPSPSTPYNRTRVPHSQVERKYRRALSAELERLRETIPHLVQVDTQSEYGSSKPSKATILASAIDYIKRIERDCLGLRSENALLRDAWKLSQRQQAA